MNRPFGIAALLGISLIVPMANAWAVPNPVCAIPGAAVADCGTMKFNGEYYLAGNFLGGDMLVSPDLVHWGNRTHVFSMNNQWATGDAGKDIEIHACDPSYYNGVFHLYWSVNRGDLDIVHIGHATARNPLGPYYEPVKEHWFDDSIDAHLFRDDDGSFTFYSVKFTGGNVIWGQPMKDPSTLADSPKPLLSALKGTWEWLDDKVNEGPFVFKYRGTYYMLYNANHTVKGHYAIGCATADSPLGFSNASKYADPVIDDAILPDGTTYASPGQPTVVRGPNGIEWWLVYFVDSAQGRQQAIDRVHFFDKRLTIDGPTCARTPGYHPEPSQPTFRDLFNGPDTETLPAHWVNLGGDWVIRNKEAHQLERAESRRVIAQSTPARHYVVEVSMRFLEKTGERAGVIAYYQNADNWLVFGLDQEHLIWYCKKRENGSESSFGFATPRDFDFLAWHTLRVARNGSQFQFSLDGRPADTYPVHVKPETESTAWLVPGQKPNPKSFPRIDYNKVALPTPFAAPGLAGLCTEEAQAAFDGFLYTIGWDESGPAICDWGKSASGESATGTWTVGEQGITQSTTQGLCRAFKGDLTPEYEFSTQVTLTSTTSNTDRLVGILPVYINAENYLRANINPASETLRVTGKRDGKALPVQVAPLPRRFVLPTSEKTAQDWRYTTQTPAAQWFGATFADSAWTTGKGGFGVTGAPEAVARTAWTTSDIWMRRTFTLEAVPITRPRLWMHHTGDAEVYINGVLAWQGNGSTKSYGSAEIAPKARAALRAGANTIAVHCRQTPGGQYIDAGLYLPKIVDTPGSYNLRAVKRSDRVYLFVNGQELMSVAGRWPASQVGIETENTTCRFNGITFFRLGSQ